MYYLRWSVDIKGHCVVSAKLYDSCHYKLIVTELVMVKVKIIKKKKEVKIGEIRNFSG